VVAFGNSELVIDPSLSVPFTILTGQAPETKAFRLTSIKY